MKVIVISAHPDDDIIGVGGIIYLLSYYLSFDLFSIIISNGEEGYNNSIFDISIELRRQSETTEAHKLLGIYKSIYLKIPDMEIHSNKMEIIKNLVSYIRDIKPNVIFTHSPDDIHPDHISIFQYTKESVIISSSNLWPDLGNPWLIKYLYSYDGLRAQMKFPTHIIPIDEVMNKKCEALRLLKSQYDRTNDLIQIVKKINNYRSIQAKCTYAEALTRFFIFPLTLNYIEYY